jgi:hypothetical protein
MIGVTVDGSAQRVMAGERLIDALTSTETRSPMFVTTLSLAQFKPVIHAWGKRKVRSRNEYIDSREVK